MTMIIVDEKEFAFVHIPKCGGLSISMQVARRVDSDKRFLERERDLEGVGPMMMAHLPLPTLKAHFPDAFEKVARYDSYAVVRNPVGRFRSSLAQHVREFHGRTPAELTSEELQGMAETAIAKIREAPLTPNTDFVHFTRQRDFVFDGDARVVRTLYPIERLSDLVDVMAQRLDLTLDREYRLNQTYTFKPGFSAAVMPRLKRVAEAVLPPAALAGAKNRLRDVVMTDKFERVSGPMEDVMESASVRSFIDEFYAEDAALHRDALSARTAA